MTFERWLELGTEEERQEQLNEEAADEEWHGDDTWAEHGGDR